MMPAFSSGWIDLESIAVEDIQVSTFSPLDEETFRRADVLFDFIPSEIGPGASFLSSVDPLLTSALPLKTDKLNVSSLPCALPFQVSP